MQSGSTGLPKEKKHGTLSHLLWVFIFRFSFLGKGVLVLTLQMHESALPQAAPAVCLTRGAVSGRMDFLNLSSHFLCCFPLTTFTNSSRYNSPVSAPLTFSYPTSLPYAPSPSTLAPSSPFSCPTTVSCMLKCTLDIPPFLRFLVPAVGRSLISEAFEDSAYWCFNVKKLKHC